MGLKSLISGMFTFPMPLFTATAASGWGTNTKAARFDIASLQTAEVAAGAGVDMTGAFTIELWIKFHANPGTGARGIVAHWNNTMDAGLNQYMLYYYGSGTKGLYMTVGKPSDHTTQSQVGWAWTPTLDTWYHIAVTNVGSGATASRFELFLDTVSQGNGTVISNNTFTGQSTSVAKALLNCWFRYDTSSYMLDTSLDQIRLWDGTVRTQPQIAADYQSVIDPDSPGGAVWRFEDDWTDSSSNGKDLTDINSPTFVTDIPF